MIDLNEMFIFAKVVEQESVTAASRVLGMPKSTISRKLAQLEKRLDARLLERTTRRLRLTEIGTLYYEWCVRIMAEAQEADIAVQRMQSEPRGLLRVTAPPLFGEVFLSPLLPGFLQKYPEVHLDLYLTDKRIDLLESGFDIGIRIGQLEDSSLIARKLGVSTLRIVASPAYLESIGPLKSPSELRHRACLLPGSPDRYLSAWTFQSPEGSVAVPLQSRLRVNSFPLLREAAIAGLGIAFLPAFLCLDDLREGRLVSLFEEWTPMQASVFAVYPSSQHLSTKVRAFLDYLVSQLPPSFPLLPQESGLSDVPKLPPAF